MGAQILIQTDSPIEDVAEKFAAATGTPLTQVETHLGFRYEWGNSRAYLVLEANDYEGPVGELNFDDFPYVIDLKSHHLDEPEHHAWMAEIVQPLFEALVALDCYHLALIDDLDVVIAEAGA